LSLQIYTIFTVHTIPK